MARSCETVCLQTLHLVPIGLYLFALLNSLFSPTFRPPSANPAPGPLDGPAAEEEPEPEPELTRKPALFRLRKGSGAAALEIFFSHFLQTIEGRECRRREMM